MHTMGPRELEKSREIFLSKSSVYTALHQTTLGCRDWMLINCGLLYGCSTGDKVTRLRMVT